MRVDPATKVAFVTDKGGQLQVFDFNEVRFIFLSFIHRRLWKQHLACFSREILRSGPLISAQRTARFLSRPLSQERSSTMKVWFPSTRKLPSNCWNMFQSVSQRPEAWSTGKVAMRSLWDARLADSRSTRYQISKMDLSVRPWLLSTNLRFLKATRWRHHKNIIDFIRRCSGDLGQRPNPKVLELPT